MRIMTAKNNLKDTVKYNATRYMEDAYGSGQRVNNPDLMLSGNKLSAYGWRGGQSVDLMNVKYKGNSVG